MIIIWGIYLSESRNVGKSLIRSATDVTPIGIIQISLRKLGIQKDLSRGSKNGISHQSLTEFRLENKG